MDNTSRLVWFMPGPVHPDSISPTSRQRSLMMRPTRSYASSTWQQLTSHNRWQISSLNIAILKSKVSAKHFLQIVSSVGLPLTTVSIVDPASQVGNIDSLHVHDHMPDLRSFAW